MSLQNLRIHDSKKHNNNKIATLFMQANTHAHAINVVRLLLIAIFQWHTHIKFYLKICLASCQLCKLTSGNSICQKFNKWQWLRVCLCVCVCLWMSAGANIKISHISNVQRLYWPLFGFARNLKKEKKWNGSFSKR